MRNDRAARPLAIEKTVRPVGPHTFLRRGRPTRGGPVVVTAGDSITHGFISANWVQLLDDALGPDSYTFVNAGISGDLAWNLLQRLDSIIACDPDVVTVLIGTNDAAAQIDDAWRDGYMKSQRLPQHPDKEWYRANLDLIITRLQNETSAEIVLLELPPLGEERGSRYDTLTAEYTAIVHNVGRARNVPVLPIRTRMLRMLPTSGQPWDGSKKLMGRSFFKRMLLRRSWNAIAADHGLDLLVDHIHLSDRGALIVCDEVRTFLQTP